MREVNRKKGRGGERAGSRVSDPDPYWILTLFVGLLDLYSEYGSGSRCSILPEIFLKQLTFLTNLAF